MDFFRKKEEKKTELPELPGMERMPELPQLPQLPSNFRESEMAREESEPMKSFSYGEPSASKSREISKEPVFVKLEKFKEAIEKFEDIKVKVGEIDSSLIKLREIKDKEENELKSWEEEIRSIKEKVASIDSSLFSKI